MKSSETVFLNPQPIPPRQAAEYLVSLVSQRELLLETGDVDRQWISQIDSAVSRFVDEYCGTRPPRPFPPFPFLQLDSTAVLTELTIRANMLPEGNLRDSLLDVARGIVSQTPPNADRVQPLTCEQLAEKITAKDLEIQALQDELGQASTPQKGSIARMIVRATRIYEALVRQAKSTGCPVP